MNYTKTLTLDVGGGPVQTVYAKQLDKDSRCLAVTLTAQGEKLSLPTGALVRLRAEKPDGTSILNDCIVEGDIILVMLTEQLLSCVGLVRADLGVYDGDALLSSAPFVVQVARSTVNGDLITSTDEFDALTNALTGADAAITAANTAAKECTAAISETNVAAETAHANAQLAVTNAALAENAASAVSGVVTKVQSAAEAANTAATAAEAAATQATQASTSANAASEHCATATSNANIAAETANRKAQLAATNAALAENAAAAANRAASGANAAIEAATSGARLAETNAALASTASSAANTAAQRANTAADACDEFVNQEIDDVVNAAIGTKVDTKVDEAVRAMVGRPNGMAGLDGNGKVSPMPTATDVGAAPATHSHNGYAEAVHTHADYAASTHSHSDYAASLHAHTAGELTGVVSIDKGGTGATTVEGALTNLGASPVSHMHGDYADATHAHDYAATSHNHSNYAETAHVHEGYSASDHAHDGYSVTDHTHSTTEIKTGTLPVARGGTGGTTVALARYMLGLGNTSGAVPIANGGTGSNSAAKALTNLGAAAANHTHTMADIIDAAATFSMDSVSSGSSGWQLLSMADGVTGTDPVCKTNGDVVLLAGSLTCSLVSGTALLATLPENCRPTHDVRLLAAAGEGVAHLTVHPDGTITCDWAYHLPTGQPISTASITLAHQFRLTIQ